MHIVNVFPYLFYFQPTQQNARARRTSYASADSDETLNLSAEDLGQQGEPLEDKNKE